MNDIALLTKSCAFPHHPPANVEERLTVGRPRQIDLTQMIEGHVLNRNSRTNAGYAVYCIRIHALYLL